MGHVSEYRTTPEQRWTCNLCKSCPLCKLPAVQLSRRPTQSRSFLTAQNRKKRDDRHWNQWQLTVSFPESAIDFHVCKLGSCPTLPHGYMVGEGKEGVQTTELTDETLPKTQRHHPAASSLATLSRPRLSTPVVDGHDRVFKPVAPSSAARGQQPNKNRSQPSWGARIWRQMITSSR